MTNIKRAILFIKRNVGKSITLFLIIGFISTIIFGSITLQSSGTQIQKNFLKENAPNIYLTYDFDKIIQKPTSLSAPEFEILTYADFQEIEKFPEVTKVIFSQPASIKPTNIDESVAKMQGTPGDDEKSADSREPFFTVVGLDDVKKSGRIDAEKYTYEKGFSSEEIENGTNVLMISKKLAEKNGLSIGDKVEFSDILSDSAKGTNLEGLETNNFTFTIVDTYEYTLSAEEAKKEGSNDYIYDEMFIPFKSTMNINNGLYDQAIEKLGKVPEKIEDEYMVVSQLKDTLTGIITLDKIESKDIVAKKTNELKKVDYFIAEDNSVTAYEKYGDLFAYSKSSSVMLTIATFLLIIILSLVITLFVRDRKNELGILIALGEKKIKIYFQLVLELTIVMTIAMIIAIPIGYFVANQIISMPMANLFGGFQGYIDTSAELLNLPFNPMSIVYFYGIGIFIILVSTAIPTLYTLRLSPKKILL